MSQVIENLARRKLGDEAVGPKSTWDKVPLQAIPGEHVLKDPSTWKTLTDRARGLGGLGERLPLSIETLTKAFRGGIPAGKLIVIGGAPGACKTSYSVREAVQWAMRGIWVAICAADEDADGILIRIGQILGLDREKLENGDTDTRAELVCLLDQIPTLMLVDMDEEDVIVEEVSAELERRAAGKPTVLVVDSIQKAKVWGVGETDGPRARVDLVIDVLKREAKQKKHRVIATCELARGAYRSSNAAERTDDLASFKESSGIEYGATAALVFRSVPGDGGLVDVSIAKNRLGQKLSCRMEMSFARATFREVEMPVEGTASALQAVKDKVVSVVSKSIVPITSKGELQRRTKANRTAVWKAIDELLEEGDLEVVNKAFKLTVPDRTEDVPGTQRDAEPYHRTRPIGAVRVTGTVAGRSDSKGGVQ